MGIFKSARKFIVATFDAGTETAQSAEKALHSVNHFVHEHSKANDRIVTTSAQRRVAEFRADHKADMDEDEDLAALMQEVIDGWDDDDE